MSKDDINAFLGAGTNYEGKLSFQGTVRVDGSFKGEINSDGVLITGKDSKIEGLLNIGELSLFGNFVGDVHAKRRVVIYKGGVLSGNIYSPVLVLEEGAVLDGSVYMSQTKTATENEKMIMKKVD